jgi:sugar phosphate isomerase/epimerase
MEIGFLTWVFQHLSLEELFPWAAENGLSGLELDNCPDDIPRLKALLSRHPQVRVYALGRSQNYLVGSAAERAVCASLLSRDIEVAAELDIHVINIFAGRDPYKTVEENLPIFQEVFTPLVAKAEAFGVRLAMENCAQTNWWPAGGNLAHTPELWRKLFGLIPSAALGLTFDPSHFVWQGMDYLKAVREFGPRIYYAHAKDTEIHADVLADRGIYGTDWWHYRLPGWGRLDWPGFLTALREVGYRGPIAIEHEDRYWNHDDEEIKHGLLMARDFLKRFDL